MKRVRILEGVCQGHARCISLAPDVFDLDDEGYAFVMPGCELVADDDPSVQLAIDNCPEQAIVLDDDASAT